MMSLLFSYCHAKRIIFHTKLTSYPFKTIDTYLSTYQFSNKSSIYLYQGTTHATTFTFSATFDIMIGNRECMGEERKYFMDNF